ncbi:short-chain dehydrogenase [Rhexocercosporidium sp. MPI-PUGE-AT-0058]|nr:short-chain dehydrogenase [Rhexocercosporidium sp. MPI-PUGE-AT-0058]
MSKTYLIVGATRGIGLEFTTQLLSQGHIVIATARSPTRSLASTSTPNPNVNLPTPPPSSASKLWALTGTPNGHNLTILECDVSDEGSIKTFTEEVRKLGRKGGVLERGVIDVAVLNAGILEYPGRVSEISFDSFAHHLRTNTIGPLVTASHLLSLSSTSTPSLHSSTAPISPTHPSTPIHINTLVFTSSDSGSTTNFRSFEDGFGAYSTSKAALNQGLRHLSAELHRKSQSNSESQGHGKTVVLALHPGEVSTDMASGPPLPWEVEGIITPEESIRCMLKVIGEKGFGGVDEGGRATAKSEGTKQEEGAATFWTWEGRRYPW